jgi:hypothetical protein
MLNWREYGGHKVVCILEHSEERMTEGDRGQYACIADNTWGVGMHAEPNRG